MSWIVPADKEAELDAFWKGHETWMRKTHTIGNVFADDDTKPRLMHYFISKGPEMTDPMDPSKVCFQSQSTSLTGAHAHAFANIVSLSPCVSLSLTRSDTL